MKLVITLLVLSLEAIGYGQSIPNGDFESWGPYSWGDTLNGWTSSDDAANLFVPFTVELNHSTSGYLGDGVELNSNTFGFTNEPVVGLLMNGNPVFDFAPGAGTSYVSGGGTPIAVNPISVEGYFKCIGSYDGFVEVAMTSWNSFTVQRDTLGFGSLILALGTVNWSAFSVPITYSLPGTADTISVLFHAAHPAQIPSIFGSLNTLYLDEISLVLPAVSTMDFAVASIDAPLPGVNVSAAQVITATFENAGTIDVIDPIVHFSDGTAEVTESFIGTIAAGATQQIVFTQPWIPSSPGNVNICVYSDLQLGDINQLNDTLCVNIIADVPDLELLTIDSPLPGALISGAQDIMVTISNPGSVAMTDPDLTYTVNGGTPITETYIGTLLPGNTASFTFTQQWQATGAGNYEICTYVSSINDLNTSNDTLCVNVISVLSLESPEHEEILTVYPNPCSSNIIVELKDGEQAELSLFDHTGNLVASQEMSSSKTELRLENLNPGVYYVRVKNDSFLYTQKLMKID